MENTRTYEKGKMYTIYNLRIAKKLLKYGYQIVDIDVNKKFFSKIVFHFYDHDGKIKEFMELVKCQNDIFNNDKEEN